MKRAFIFFSIILLFSNHYIRAQIREDCIPPESLSAWAYYDEPFPFATEINWSHPMCYSEWLYYDDGVCVDGIGGPTTFSWGIKFDPEQLNVYESLSVTMIRIYNLTSATNTLQIFEDTNATTLLYEQELVGLDIESWNIIELDSSVLIDVSKELWITIYTTHGNNYLAACGNTTNEPNGDLITMDGITWEHLTDYNLPYTWNLGCYVEYAGGKKAILGTFEYKNTYPKDSNLLVVSAHDISPNIWHDENHSNREWIGFNLYRNDELIAEEITGCSYIDYDATSNSELYCYYATSVYSICGESDPSDEDCFAWWMLSVDEKDKLTASLYPSIATNYITIEAENMIRISLINMEGEQLYVQQLNSASKHTIDINHFKSGIYIARIYTEDAIIFKKFLIGK